jgi:hypothetical protein
MFFASLLISIGVVSAFTAVACGVLPRPPLNPI